MEFNSITVCECTNNGDTNAILCKCNYNEKLPADCYSTNTSICLRTIETRRAAGVSFTSSKRIHLELLTFLRLRRLCFSAHKRITKVLKSQRPRRFSSRNTSFAWTFVLLGVQRTRVFQTVLRKVCFIHGSHNNKRNSISTTRGQYIKRV